MQWIQLMDIFQYNVVVGFLNYVLGWREAKTQVMSIEQYIQNKSSQVNHVKKNNFVIGLKIVLFKHEECLILCTIVCGQIMKRFVRISN